jgi:hypothetical protein
MVSSTPFAYPQVGPRHFALFRVLKFSAFAGQRFFMHRIRFPAAPQEKKQARTEKSWPASKYEGLKASCQTQSKFEGRVYASLAFRQMTRAST